MNDRAVRKRLNLTPRIREKPPYHLDPAFDGHRLMRLPDRTLVLAEEYETRLAEFEHAGREGDNGDETR
jgi:hypothetical protein